ncbi:dimethylarginine dimethylaminohydrolase family protein [Nocardia barduliensis]|uniref:dimethylarginine dimethylaminohydrolase family protein n=1 Tax=Nocardia barduliensis TaxID=2736643 RepID=UPI0028AC6141|nr:arginine deiminase family protein [Nocardia barduliensis]
MRRVGVDSEFGELRSVVMRHAGPVTLDLSGSVDPVLARQRETSRWGPYSPVRVRAQQDRFIDLLRGRGVEVVLAEQVPGSYGQHYTRDIGFVVDDVFVVSRLHSRRRQGEFAGVRRLVERIERVAYLDAGTIEGGDVMLHDGLVLVGLSEETSPAGVDALRYQLDRLGSDRTVRPIEFACGGIVHLDDHFNIVAPEVALVHPGVFDDAQMRWFAAHFDLIPVTGEEAAAVEVNALALGPGVVVVAERSERIAAQLDARGIEVFPVDYSEVTRIPGGFRCSTLPLARASAVVPSPGGQQFESGLGDSAAVDLDLQSAGAGGEFAAGC